MVKTKPEQLTEDELLEVLRSLPSDFDQGHRMLNYLGYRPNSITGDVAHVCAIGNLSDVARNANSYLYKHGLIIACEPPSVKIKNRFGEDSNQYLWSVYRLPEAANDPIYQQASKG
jgi:hypothetical protein